MEFAPLMNKMLVFIIMMVIAWWLARRGVLTPDFTRIASRLVLNVFMTGTILSSMISTGEEMGLGNLADVVILTTVTMVIGYLIAAIVARVVPLSGDHRPVYELLVAVGNSIFIAMPIAQSLYGPYAVFVCSVSCIPFNAFLYSYGVWRLKSGSGEVRLHLKEIFSIPLIVTLIGIVIILLRIPVPQAARDVLTTLGGATVPMSMMVIGASLGSVTLLDAFKNPKFAVLSVMRLLVIPVITWAVCRMMTSDTVLLMTCMLIAAAPCAVIVSVVTMQCGRDAVFASEGVQYSTVCSMITIPLLIRLLAPLS